MKVAFLIVFDSDGGDFTVSCFIIFNTLLIEHFNMTTISNLHHANGSCYSVTNGDSEEVNILN
ncbi:hypothetical protein CR513_58090, partial [Mucuna pruriens]